MAVALPWAEKNLWNIFSLSWNINRGSLASTDSDNEPDLSKMTKAEREKYFADKATRKAEREKKRKEKFGDEYEAMMEKHKK